MRHRNFSLRLWLLAVLLAFGVRSNAASLSASSQGWHGCGVDARGFYIELLVAWYNDSDKTYLSYGQWFIKLNGTEYLLFQAAASDQGKSSSSYWCDFGAAEWPLFIDVTSGTDVYNPGRQHWGSGDVSKEEAGTWGNYSRRYRWTRAACTCDNLANGYVRVYLPSKFWNSNVTVRWECTWNGKTTNTGGGGTVTVRSPLLVINSTTYSVGETPGKINMTITFRHPISSDTFYKNSNLSYVAKPFESVTFTDAQAQGSTSNISGTFSAAKSDVYGTMNMDVTTGGYKFTDVIMQEYKCNTNYTKAASGTAKLSYTDTYKNIKLPGVTYPKNIVLEPRQLSKSILVSWTKQEMYFNDGKFYIYRYNVSSSGATSNGKLLTPDGLSSTVTSYEDTDENLAYDQKYRYVVFFGLTGWKNISTPVTALSDQADVTITRSFPFTLSVTDSNSKITLSWSVPASNANLTYTVYRKYGSNDYTSIGTVQATTTDPCTLEYTDGTATGSTQYTYQVKVTTMSKEFTSTNQISARLGNLTKITELTATKGEYSGMVKVSWKSKQVGSGLTRYIVSRKLLGSNDEYIQIYVTESTGQLFYYEDVTALPGQYYIYKVEALIADEDQTEWTTSNEKTDDGFSIAKGIVSGRITYGTGTAVPDAKVILTPGNSEETASQFYSMRITDRGDGITVPITTDMEKKMFTGNQPFTVEMWVRPDAGIRKISNSSESVVSACVFTVNGQFGVDAKPVSGNTEQYTLLINSPDGQFTTNLTISSSEFSHISFSNDGNGLWQIRLVEGDSIITYSLNCTKAPSLNSGEKTICIGYPKSINVNHTFTGYVDEFRLWSKCLSDKEILQYCGRILSGSESGLKVYLPMDEGIQDPDNSNGFTYKVYDYSKTAGVVNSCHGTLKASTTMSKVVPTESQLSLHAYTDTQGSYTVNGVPFNGEGTSYTVRPVLGIHEFSPQYLTRYVNANSLTHNGVDFTDVSSFSVSGKILYENTLYPVEGCNIYVDGTICSLDGEPVESGASGCFTVSVPIGSHYITVKKSGHEFKSAGRYPEDPNGVGTKVVFDHEISSGQDLMFYDETLVNLTGRVTGGDIQSEYAYGFGLSKNNIGQVEIQLAPTTGELYSLNVDSDGRRSQTELECESATGKIASTAKRGKGDYSHMIYITTDAATGEFSALLPPLSYTVKKMTVINNDIQLPDGQSVDMSNPLVTYTDTLESDGSIYEYNTLLTETYYAAPTFIVEQDDNQIGAFGIDTCTIWSNEVRYDVPVYENNGGKPAYKFGDMPMFISGDPYTFNLTGYEKYVNADDQSTDYVPLSDVVVTISNAMSSSQKVLTESGTVDGQSVEAGQVYDLQDNQLTLDSLGKGTYTWTAGYPNVSGDHSRSLSISYEANGKPYDWSGNFKGIILGALPSGNNFVTSGPDHLSMILRDPPGTNSKAEWSSGTVTTKSRSDGGCWSVDELISVTTHFGVETQIGTGLGVIMMSKLEGIDDLETGAHVTSEGEDATTTSTSLTITNTVSTKDTPEYVGAGGDVFVGMATNIILGQARNVGLYRNANDGTYSLEVKDIYTAGQKFGTVFHYDQLYIVNTLLPNLISLRNSMLRYYGSDPEPTVNNGNSLMYISHLSEDHEKFGSSNDDRDVWGSQAVKSGYSDGPSYKVLYPESLPNDTLQDSVHWCNLQIAAWEQYLALNEEEKVKAYENREEYLERNVSFDTGADVDFEYEYEESHGTTYEHTTGCNLVVNNTAGVTVNGMGLTVNVQTENGGSKHLQEEESESTVTKFAYTLSEDGDDDAITVDIYDYGAYSRIFRTRGGQTCGPYEGEAVTEYYQPGTVIMEATQQIELPEIEVVTASVSNVPSGSAANFTLRMFNQSEIGEDVYYKLLVIDESNPDGARIFIDGQVLTEGRNIKVPAGETITKSLQLYQSNQSILEYENIGIVLASQTQYDPTSTWDQIADTCWISAYFVPSASAVTMELDNTILNTKSISDNNPDPVVAITFKGFDRNYYNQKAFRIQYRQPGDNSWTLLREYLLDSTQVKSSFQEYLADVAKVTYQFNMDSYNDGQYTFRVLSACTYGTEEVTVSSEEITLIKDMKRPQVLGNPKPLTGILTQGDDISITFNEDINSDLLTELGNFKVTAQLNEATIANDVAIRSAGSQDAIAQTYADINLSGMDFAMDMWVNVTSAGTLVAHGNGQNKFIIGVDTLAHLTVGIGSESYTSFKTVELGKWIYLAISYSKDSDRHILNALTATDASTSNLFMDEEVAGYTGNGRLSVLSDGISAALHDLTLWDEGVPVTTLQACMHETKKPSTDNLIGYWRFDEGTGLAAADKARSRGMALSGTGSWYMNVENKALGLWGAGYDAYISINTSACAIPGANDYAIELWFKAEDKGTIFSVGNNLVLSVAESGLMELASGSYTLNLGTKKVFDSKWHHFALNVLRNGMTTVYIDGQNVAQTSSANIGYMQSDAMILGAKRSYDSVDGYSYSQYFKGCIDDVRIWNASMNATAIRDGMYSRLEGTEDGLVAYYPFEQIQYDSGNQPKTAYWLGDKTGQAANATQTGGIHVADGPAQTPAKNLTNVSFSYVASERTIVINLTENADLIEGTTVNMTVKNVQDMNGNNCEPVKWTAYINCNQLVWNESDIDLKIEEGQTATFTATVANNSAVTEQWSIDGMPSWLSADLSSGTLTALSRQTITFTVSDAIQLGRHNVTLMLSGNNDIEVPLLVNLRVSGEEPEWSVNAAGYAGNMTIFGQINNNGTLSENTDDIVAAFIDGECRGIGSPVYYPRYDAYFTQMMVYGNEDDDSQPVEFKVWNASDGKVYPSVSCMQSGSPVSMTYSDNGTFGSVASTLIWNTDDNIEETLILQKGWNWTSLYIDNKSDMSLGSMLADINLDGNYIKGFNYFAESDGASWTGDPGFTNLEVGQMYLLKSVAHDTLTMVGAEVDPADYPLYLGQNWNWIGLNASYNIDINQAFSYMTPESGDIVKSQNAFAIYDGYEWIGRLTALTPGKGYMYNSLYAGLKYCVYPSYAAVTGSSKSAARRTGADSESMFEVDESARYEHQSNMTIVARVMDGDFVKTDAEVGVFVDGQCRDASSTAAGDLVFLIVPGEQSETLSFEVAVSGVLYSLRQTIAYEPNLFCGTLENPYVLQLDNTTKVEGIGEADTSDIYNVAGQKVDGILDGIVIKGGAKVLKSSSESR